jgi:hypothetical protein
MSSHWEYQSATDTVSPEQLPTDWVWERLRNRRDNLLAATDYRMVTDAPWNTEPWSVYRQALRDLPDATSDPRTAVWPVSPA